MVAVFTDVFISRHRDLLILGLYVCTLYNYINFEKEEIQEKGADVNGGYAGEATVRRHLRDSIRRVSPNHFLPQDR